MLPLRKADMADGVKSNWQITYSNQARKSVKHIPKNIKVLLDLLAMEMEKEGPYRKDWPNYGPLRKGGSIPDNSYHCHLKKGRPTYVACWKIEDKTFKKVEIFYVGSHENAPY